MTGPPSIRLGQRIRHRRTHDAGKPDHRGGALVHPQECPPTSPSRRRRYPHHESPVFQPPATSSCDWLRMVLPRLFSPAGCRGLITDPRSKMGYIIGRQIAGFARRRAMVLVVF